MSSIPIIFNRPSPHTIIGQGHFHEGRLGVSLVLLNRGGKFYREETLAELSNQGWSEILSLEEGGTAGDFEELAQKFRSVKFLIIPSKTSPGERINMGIQEARSPRVMIAWSDQKFSDQTFYPKMVKNWSESEHLCLSGELKGKDGEEIPAAAAPFLAARKLKILFLPPGDDSQETLFPFDYSGLYHRQKFLASGGYDPNLPNPWWQKLDFGLRAYLWGESITVNKALKLQYVSTLPVEDQSADKDYLTVLLRGLLPIYDGRGGVLKTRSFLRYFTVSGLAPLKAWKIYRQAQIWVGAHRLRYRIDARTLIETWGSRG